jgi:hypothetical protein
MIVSRIELKMFPRLAALTVMLFAAMVCGAGSAYAQFPVNTLTAGLTPTHINLGVMNVTLGQTARLNVVYTKVVNVDPTVPPDPYIPPDPYRVTLSFIDSDGRVVAQNIVSLAIGRPALLDFTPTDPNVGSIKVRAAVNIERNNSALLPAVMPSVEVFNNDTGRTSAFNPGALSSFNHQTDLTGFGMFGIARNQTARLNVAYIGFHNPPADHNPPSDHNPPGDHNPPDDRPAPANITLQFVNGDGRVMAESRQVVEFGKAVSFDFPAGAFPAGVRQRLRAVVIIAPTESGLAPCVMPSVEVLNNDTGKAAVFYSGPLVD